MRSASTNATEENVEVVVLGGSAGAIEALGVILPKLPASFRLPVIVVVHLPPNSAFLLVDAFGHCGAAAKLNSFTRTLAVSRSRSLPRFQTTGSSVSGFAAGHA